MNAMDQALAAFGVPDDRVRFEAFGPATIERRRKQASAATSGVAPMISFSKSAITASFDPHAMNLLEFAEDLGLSPPFNCRSGSCGTCATRKLSGTIRYVEEPTAVLADDEVLLCCALPAGPVSLDL
jgi:ferredoxin